MDSFLSAYTQDRVDERTVRVSETLWFHWSPRAEFGKAMQLFEVLMTAEEEGVAVEELRHSQFDMVVLSKLELGQCHVIHGSKIQPMNCTQFRNVEAELVQCSCGRYAIKCNNPAVQRCCE